MPHLRRPTRAQTLTVLALLATAPLAAVTVTRHHATTTAARLAALTPLPPAPPAPATPAPVVVPQTAAPVPVATTAPPPPAPPPPPARPAATSGGGLIMAGCPPPPAAPPHFPPPWHPAVLVPESALPPPAPADAPAAPLDALSGKGMWVWQYHRTEGGDPQAIVDRAVAAGLHQIWVRVADSQDDFYGDDELAAIVPRAHRRGLAVIAWGFPHLYDPAADARWSRAVLDWRAGSDRVDGFSADIETASEGVALTARRAALYLSLVRQARDGRPLIATVYPPTDHWMTAYPFSAMAPYIDAYAPMEYWECRDPGAAAAEAIARLARLRPVHLIGQAFSFGDVAGRVDLPSPAELERFMAVCRSRGAVGVSFWVWQSMNAAEWAELAAFPWVR